MKAIIAAIFVLAAGYAQAGQPSPLPQQEPYGIWISNAGEVIIIRRNGTYTFCDSRLGCEDGRHIPEGPNTVALLGFTDLKGTETLRVVTGWQGLLDNPGPNGDDDKNPSFGDLEPSDPDRHALCKDQPCSILGPTDQGYIKAFFKVANY